MCNYSSGLLAVALALNPRMPIGESIGEPLYLSGRVRSGRISQAFAGVPGPLGFVCLVISHDLAVVDALAHRIAVMYKGKLVEQGTSNQILRAPKDPYTQRLISAVPVPDPAEQRARREARQTAKRQNKE
jgi:peptide/nickel transport system ATP-binding protein